MDLLALIDRRSANLDGNRLRPISNLIRFFDTLALFPQLPGSAIGIRIHYGVGWTARRALARTQPPRSFERFALDLKRIRRRIEAEIRAVWAAWD